MARRRGGGPPVVGHDTHAVAARRRQRVAKRVVERCLLEMKSYIRSKEIQNKKSYLKQAQDKLHNLKTRSEQIVHNLERQMANEIRKVTRGRFNSYNPNSLTTDFYTLHHLSHCYLF